MVSSIYYNGDGSTRIFPVSFKILGDDYIRVYVDDVEVVDKTKYDIINNSVVFTTSETPAIGVDNVKIFVATSSSELGDLGAPLFDITSVANNLQEIIDVSESLSTIASVNDNEANINLVGANTANMNTVANDISNVNTVAEWIDTGFPIVETGNTFVVETVEELSSIPAGYKVAIVSDLSRGGTFEWSATGTANGGTVFAGVSGYWNRQYSGAVNVKWFGIKENYTPTISSDNAIKLKYLLENFENIEIVDSNIYVDNFTSSNVVTKVLKLVNSKLTLDGGNIDLTLLNDLVIDLQDNGIINGGLRYAILSADVAVGTTVLPVESGHTFRVGDRVTNGNSGDESFPDADRGNQAYKPNYITATTSNSITVLNAVGDYTGTPLFDNWYITNALFDKGGIILRGYAKVDILGGRIEDSSAGYWITTRDNIQLETFSTEFYGQGLDGFYMGEASSITHNDTYIHKSYGTAKQLVAFYSSKDFIINGGKINRGNYDVEFYMVDSNTGKVIANNVEFDGTNTLLITPNQLSSFTGLPITSVYNFIGNALHVYTISNGGIANYKGIELNNCEFVNYSRSILGTTYTFIPSSLNTIDEVIINDCKSTCPFYYFANTSNIVVNNFKINNCESESLTNYGNGYAPSLYDKIQYSGAYIYNNKNRTDAYTFTTSNYDKLVIKGGGTVPLGSGHLTTANVVDIINTNVTGIKDGVRNNYPLVNLFGTATIDNRAFINVTDYKIDCFYGASSTSWINIAKLSLNATSTMMFSTKLIPFKNTGTSRSLKGEVFGYIPIDGTEVFATMPTAGYSSLTYPSVKWTTNVVANALTVTDTMVKFRVSGGYLQMNINTSVADINVVAETTMLNKQY